MSRSPVEVILRSFRLCEGEDIDAVVACYAEDAVIRSGDPHLGRAGLTGETVFRGHHAIRRYFEEFFSLYRDLVFDVERVEEEPDSVLVVYAMSVTGRAGGTPVTRRGAIRDTVREGLIQEEIVYADPANAGAY